MRKIAGENINFPNHVAKNFIEDPFNQLSSPNARGSNLSKKKSGMATDIYTAIMNDDVKKFKM